MTRVLLNVTALVTMVACGRAVAQGQARSSADSKEAPSRLKPTRASAASATAPGTRATRNEIARLKKEIDAILSSVRTPITRELPETGRRITRIHRRGNFLDQGDPVQPSTPGYFSPLPRDAPRNRLGVALWLLVPENSLTARVAVNRHWAQLFGRGLVETQEDFGAQG